MKKIILLSVILLTTSFCEDLFELGLEAYKKVSLIKLPSNGKKLVTIMSPVLVTI